MRTSTLFYVRVDREYPRPLCAPDASTAAWMAFAATYRPDGPPVPVFVRLACTDAWTRFAVDCCGARAS